MLSSIKAAIISVVTSIKSSIPTIVAVTTATVLTGGCIYYYTIKDGIYEKSKSNVRYALEEYINQVTIDNIVSNGRDGYAYSVNFDEEVEKIVEELKEANSNIAEYTGKNKEEKIIEKLIRAEVISLYPDLRSEDEIREDEKFRDNELQGGIKIIRKDSNNATSSTEDSQELSYDISELDKVLTYIPYEEFKTKMEQKDENVKNYFTLKTSGEETPIVEIIVAGWTEETTTVKTIEYTPNSNGVDSVTEHENITQSNISFQEISINYQNMLSSYSMPSGFLWSLLVMGENVSFIEKLADLAIENTNIVIESQDNITNTYNTNIQKYTNQRNINKTIELEDGTTSRENVTITAQNASTITTTIETRQSNTSLVLAFAETWVATYKKDYINNKNDEPQEDQEWLVEAEWEQLEDENTGTETNESENANLDNEYKEMKEKIIEEITTDKCDEILNLKIESLEQTDSLYYLFNWDNNNGGNIKAKSVDYMYNYIKSGFIEEFINNISIKNELKGYVTNFWNGKSQDVDNIYAQNNITNTHILDNLYELLKQVSNSMITLSSAQTTIISQKVQNQSTSNNQSINANSYTSAGTSVQERTEIDKDHNFVAYFNKSGRAKEYILQSPEWIYEMLETHEKTANMVDLFKYLLYKATNQDYGVTSYTFETYTEMLNATQSSLEQYIKFMHSWEGTPPEEGDYYKVFDDGFGNLTVGWGICFYSRADGYMKESAFEKYGYNIRDLGVGDKVLKTAVDSINSDIVQSNIERVESITTGLNLTQYQKYALVDRMYQSGNINGFVDAYNQYWKEEDNALGEPTSAEDYTHGLARWFIGSSTGGVANRRKAEWLVFKYGYYNRTNEYYSERSYNSDFYYGISLYDAEGRVIQSGMDALENHLTTETLHTVYHIDNKSASQTGPFEKWWQNPNNTLQKFQCTWWVKGRASQYLELTGNKYTEYPRSADDGRYGNANEWYQKNINAGWFNYGQTPKANSIISWRTGNEWGHVAYVEAYDPVTEDIWISHAGGGDSWYGIQKLTKASGYRYSTGISLIGFIYLDEPK